MQARAQRLALGQRWHRHQHWREGPVRSPELGDGVTTGLTMSGTGAMAPTWMQRRWNQALAQPGQTMVV